MADQPTDQPETVPVRVKMWPDRDHHVRPDEIEPLRRQGLLIEEKPDSDGKPDSAKADSGRPGGPRTGPRSDGGSA
jgi:hypothetical protein